MSIYAATTDLAICLDQMRLFMTKSFRSTPFGPQAFLTLQCYGHNRRQRQSLRRMLVDRERLDQILRIKCVGLITFGV